MDVAAVGRYSMDARMIHFFMASSSILPYAMHNFKFLRLPVWALILPHTRTENAGIKSFYMIAMLKIEA